MPASEVYQGVYRLLQGCLSEEIDESSRTRLALLVTGIIGAKHAGPARVASALHKMGLRDAKPESLERHIRRIENDPEISATICFHPFARWRLLYGKPRRVFLIVDPTSQEDRIFMVSVAIWYRGRALPLAWTTWEANTPLTGKRFWERIEELLTLVSELLPKDIPVICMADRAFGAPAFTDLLAKRGWHYVVRVQGQTVCQDCTGKTRRIEHLVQTTGQRAKMKGKVFKSKGWRTASVVVFWNGSYRSPLCLISDLPPDWNLIEYYRRRYPIEALFRDYKSSGWQWEKGQVKNPDHMERLLVGMALATWIVLCIGSQVAQEILSKPSSGKRYTRPYEGKFSLFTLGLERLLHCLTSDLCFQPHWLLTDWDKNNWQTQIRSHHAFTFIWAS
jgi:hypothetical protein